MARAHYYNPKNFPGHTDLCFYTKVKIIHKKIEPGRPLPWNLRTKEHLIPKLSPYFPKLTALEHKRAVVSASHVANSALGNHPLRVKMTFKRMFRDLQLGEEPTEREYREAVRATLNAALEVHGIEQGPCRPMTDEDYAEDALCLTAWQIRKLDLSRFFEYVIEIKKGMETFV